MPRGIGRAGQCRMDRVPSHRYLPLMPSPDAITCLRSFPMHFAKIRNGKPREKEGKGIIRGDTGNDESRHGAIGHGGGRDGSSRM